MTGFQTAVNQVPAVGVEGEFASANPYFTYDAGAGGCVAGPGGVTVGRFAWATQPLDSDGAPTTILNSTTLNSPPTGFVGRSGQPALITAFLADASMVIPVGYGMYLYTGGDFWVKNAGANQAVQGNKAYANVLTGQVTFAATGSPTATATSTGSTIASTTATATGVTISGNVLTVPTGSTLGGSGVIYPGSTVSGTGVTGAPRVVSQLSGTAGGVGTYLLDVGEQNITTGITATFTYGLLTIGTLTSTPTFAVGQVLSGTNVVTTGNGTVITAIVTGTGGSGSTMVVTNNATVSSTAINGNGNVETKFIAMSTGLANELVKISDHALG